MIKVAIITERANITLGGVEKSVFELAAAMSLNGVQVKILAATGTAQSHRVKILCSNSKKLVSFGAFENALRKHLSEYSYDIVHSVLPFDFADIYQPRGGTYPEALIRNAASYGNNNIRIFKLLTSFFNFRKTRFANAEKKICTAETGPIVAALSEYVKTQFKKYYNLPDERIKVIHNGIKHIKNIDNDRCDRLRSQVFSHFNLKEADEPVFFIFVANNFRLKGFISLVKAVAALKEKHTKRPAYLIVAGRGKVNKYKRICAKAGVLDRIIFMGQPGNIRNLLSISHIAVLPTYYSPANRFILEALAEGKPVITTKFNGASDLFDTGRHAIVFDTPDNIEALTEAMRFYCVTQNIDAARNAILTDDIKSKVSIQTHCEKLLELYKQIINSRTKK